MNIFSALRVYAGKWSEKAKRAFTSDEISAVEKATVVDSQYGQSVCFYMHSGCQHYIPVSRDSVVTTGTAVDLSKAKILTLERDGQTLHRIEI